MEQVKSKVRRFLIWSQKYTQTDNIYLFKGGFWLTLEQGTSSVLSFLLALAFANLLDPEVYGQYSYILSLVSTFTVFALSGVKMAVIQGVARGLEGSFYSGFKTKIKWSLLGSLAAIAAAVYYFMQGNYTLPIPLLISAIFIPLMEATGIYGGFLAGRKLFNVGAQYGIYAKIVFTLAMASTLYLTQNLLWLVAAYFALNTFLNCFFYLKTKKKFEPNRKEDPQTITYGKHLSFMGVIGRVTKELDKVMLFTFIGSMEVAVYSFAISIPNQASDILTNVTSIALPKLAVKTKEEIKKTLMKKVWKLFALSAVIIAVYIAVAPYVYKIFFPKYLTSVPYSQLFIISLIAFPAFFLTNVFRAKMLKRDLYLLRLADIVRLALFAGLIPLFGVLGAVLSLVITQILKGILIFYLFFRYLRSNG